MGYNTRELGEFKIIDVSDNIEEDRAASLQKGFTELVDAGCSRVALNMAEVSYLSSHTITALVRMWRKVTTLGGELHLISPTPVVSELLGFCSANRMMKVHESEKAFMALQRIPEETREHLAVRRSGKYRVVDVTQPVTVTNGYHELNGILKNMVEKGEQFIGINMSASDGLFSEMAGLVKKWNWKVKDSGGDFCLIGLSDQMKSRLSLMGLDKFVTVHDSEEVLVSAGSSLS